MKLTPELVEATFFSFAEKHGRSPSREEIVEELGAPGEYILDILGAYSKNIEATWRLNFKEREMLGKLISETEKNLHVMLTEICFLPVWSAECRAMTRLRKPDQ